MKEWRHALPTSAIFDLIADGVKYLLGKVRPKPKRTDKLREQLEKYKKMGYGRGRR